MLPERGPDRRSAGVHRVRIGGRHGGLYFLRRASGLSPINQMTSHSKLEREAEEVGCFGLVGGAARNLYTRREFLADQCTKNDGPFYCPSCFSDAVLRKCTEKIDHFAHKARLTPVIGPEESNLHSQCKDEILSFLQERFPNGKWEKERVISENKPKRIPELRPDISGRIQDVRIAVEVQASALTVPKIIKRAKDYTARGIALLWVVPLREPLGDRPFRPRLYERYLHSIYYGRTYYWWRGQGLILRPVHYGPAMRHVEYREWIENGVQVNGGGYDARYRIVKKPIYGRDVNIADNFVRESRAEFVPDNERKAVPACLIWRDNLGPWWE